MEKIPFDFSLGISLENFRGILLVYDKKERLVGYITTYDGKYTLQTSFEFYTPYDIEDEGYNNIVPLLVDNGIPEGYINVLKFEKL